MDQLKLRSQISILTCHTKKGDLFIVGLYGESIFEMASKMCQIFRHICIAMAKNVLDTADHKENINAPWKQQHVIKQSKYAIST